MSSRIVEEVINPSESTAATAALGKSSPRNDFEQRLPLSSESSKPEVAEHGESSEEAKVELTEASNLESHSSTGTAEDSNWALKRPPRNIVTEPYSGPLSEDNRSIIRLRDSETAANISFLSEPSLSPDEDEDGESRVQPRHRLPLAGGRAFRKLSSSDEDPNPRVLSSPGNTSLSSLDSPNQNRNRIWLQFTPATLSLAPQMSSSAPSPLLHAQNALQSKLSRGESNGLGNNSNNYKPTTEPQSAAPHAHTNSMDRNIYTSIQSKQHHSSSKNTENKNFRHLIQSDSMSDGNFDVSESSLVFDQSLVTATRQSTAESSDDHRNQTGHRYAAEESIAMDLSDSDDDGQTDHRHRDHEESFDSTEPHEHAPLDLTDSNHRSYSLERNSTFGSEYSHQTADDERTTSTDNYKGEALRYTGSQTQGADASVAYDEMDGIAIKTESISIPNHGKEKNRNEDDAEVEENPLKVYNQPPDSQPLLHPPINVPQPQQVRHSRMRPPLPDSRMQTQPPQTQPQTKPSSPGVPVAPTSQYSQFLGPKGYSMRAPQSPSMSSQFSAYQQSPRTFNHYPWNSSPQLWIPQQDGFPVQSPRLQPNVSPQGDTAPFFDRPNAWGLSQMDGSMPNDRRAWMTALQHPSLRSMQQPSFRVMQHPSMRSTKHTSLRSTYSETAINDYASNPTIQKEPSQEMEETNSTGSVRMSSSEELDNLGSHEHLGAKDNQFFKPSSLPKDRNFMIPPRAPSIHSHSDSSSNQSRSRHPTNPKVFPDKDDPANRGSMSFDASEELDTFDSDEPISVMENCLGSSPFAIDPIEEKMQHQVDESNFHGPYPTVMRPRSSRTLLESPFANLGKKPQVLASRAYFFPRTTLSEENGKKYPTFICPRCHTRQREFFSVNDAPKQLSSPASYLAVYFILYVTAAMFIFGLEEGWEPLDCVYFAVVSLTTAGLGDFVPSTDFNKIICSFFLYFGVACIGLLLGSYIASILDHKASTDAKAKQVDSCPNCARISVARDAAARRLNEHQRNFDTTSGEMLPTPMFHSERGGMLDHLQSANHRAIHKPKQHHHHQNHRNHSPLFQRQESSSSWVDPCMDEIDEDPTPPPPPPPPPAMSPHAHSFYPNSSAQFLMSPRFSATSPAPEMMNSSSQHNILGSPMTRQILGRQSHTRHTSLDIGQRFFDTGMSNSSHVGRNAPVFSSFGDDLPETQDHPASNTETSERPPGNHSTENAHNGSTHSIYYDGMSDSSDDSESSFATIVDERSERIKTAKYVFTTLQDALGNSLVILAVGCVGFYLIESFTLVDSWYFTVVLLTTTGYGDIVPVTRGGKLFATVYILVGGTMLLNHMSMISMIPLELRRRRIERAVLTQFGDTLDDDALGELATGPLIRRLSLTADRSDGLAECTREMFALAMLVRLGKVSEDDIRQTFAAFRRLDLSGEGVLNSKSIIAGMIQRHRNCAHSISVPQNALDPQPQERPSRYQSMRGFFFGRQGSLHVQTSEEEVLYTAPEDSADEACALLHQPMPPSYGHLDPANTQAGAQHLRSPSNRSF